MPASSSTASKARGWGSAGYTLRGGPLADVFKASSADDVLRGGPGDDRLFGSDGADRLDGGEGNDHLSGGSGDDTFIAGAGFDHVYGGDGLDTIDFSHSARPTVAYNARYLPAATDIDVLAGIETFILSRYDDIAYGDSAANVMRGGKGNDYMFGEKGSDTLYGGDGNDSLSTGYSGVSGQRRADMDKAYGGHGDDVLSGGEGSDRLYGGAGNDYITGSLTTSDDEKAYDGNDRLYGATGNDALYGGNGSDRVYGGRGHDTLYGGNGADNLYGGTGRDTFHVSSKSCSGVGMGHRDVIYDFSQAEGDNLAFSARDAGFSFIGLSDFTAGGGGEVRFSQISAPLTGPVTIVQADWNGDGITDLEIEIRGTVTLTAGDIVP